MALRFVSVRAVQAENLASGTTSGMTFAGRSERAETACRVALVRRACARAIVRAACAVSRMHPLFQRGRITVQVDTAECANACALVDAAGFPGVGAVLGAIFTSMAAGRRAHCDAAHCQVERPQSVTCPQSYRTASAEAM
jgi:hypothetical protein